MEFGVKCNSTRNCQNRINGIGILDIGMGPNFVLRILAPFAQ